MISLLYKLASFLFFFSLVKPKHSCKCNLFFTVINWTVWFMAFVLWVLYVNKPHPTSGGTSTFVKTSVLKKWTKPMNMLLITQNTDMEKSLWQYLHQNLLFPFWKMKRSTHFHQGFKNTVFWTISIHYKHNLVLVGGILIRLWAGWHVLITEKQSQNLSNVKTSTFVCFPKWPCWNSLPTLKTL